MKRLLIFTSALLMAVQLWSQASISIDALQEDVSGDSLELFINLNNSEPIKAIQFDLQLPSSIDFNKVKPILKKHADAFDLDYKYISDKHIRMLITSGKDELIPPDSTRLLHLNVSVASLENVKTHLFRVSDITFVYKTYRSEVVAEQSFTAFEVKEVDVQGLIYSRNSTRDAFNVFSYTDTLKSDVVIPTEIYGLPVKAIAPGALKGAHQLRSIEIPPHIQNVGENAFGGCYNLLMVAWSSPAALHASCFDEPQAYGNMLVFTQNENVIKAAADEAFAGNVVLNGKADNIHLVDDREFYNPREFTAKTIIYSREFSKQTYLNQSAGWEAMVLPFDVQYVENKNTGVMLHPFAEADFEITMPIWLAAWQQESQSFVPCRAMLPANEPFIMQVPNSREYQDQFNQAGTIFFVAHDAKVYPSCVVRGNTGAKYYFGGSYERLAPSDDFYVLNDEEYSTSEGEIIAPGGAFVAALRALRPFEACICAGSSSDLASQTRASYLRIGKDVTTGIEILKETGSPASHGSHADHWYNLQGLRLPSRPTQPGLYIHNGEKVMIK